MQAILPRLCFIGFLVFSSVAPGRSAALGVARRVVPGSDTAVVRFMLGRAEAARSATVPLSAVEIHGRDLKGATKPQHNMNVVP